MPVYVRGTGRRKQQVSDKAIARVLGAMSRLWDLPYGMVQVCREADVPAPAAIASLTWLVGGMQGQHRARAIQEARHMQLGVLA
jgi:hypothetical protein